MQDRPPPDSDAERLPASAAARLIERASELDVHHAAGSAVADLRAAAAEAGISARAFNAALAELHGQENAPVPEVQVVPRTRSRKWVAPVVEASILLRCLSPGEAAALMSPLLTTGSGTVVAGGPAALTFDATALREDRARS